MAKEIVIADKERVAAFVAERIGLYDGFFGHYSAIGLADQGGLVAGVVYNEYTVTNIFMHVAGEPGKRWMNRRFLAACFDYPFNRLNVNRVTGWVEASNTVARAFDENLGFVPEAQLEGAARDGGNVILYRMWKKDCRFLGGRYVASL